MNLLYKHERPLFIILLVLSVLIWGALLVGTKGIILVYVIAFALFYLFAQSAFISYLKGTGVEISAEQYPDLHEKIVACCDKLEVEKVPSAYLIHMGGAFNALATRFLGKNFIVLFSDIVDALEEHPDALNFYIGHELGHLKRGHLTWSPVLAPAAFLPIVGSAYSRAREYTCDRHGLSVCDEPASAQLGMAALAAGGKRWRSMNHERYILQTKQSSGFWMSLYELTSDYPWLTKRLAAINAASGGEEAKQPGRHPLAWFFALFIPRIGLGGAASGLVIIAMIGIMAAIAIPAFQEYTAKAQLSQAVQVGRSAAAAVEASFIKTGTIPESLAQAGFTLPPDEKNIQDIAVDPTNGVVTLTLAISSQMGKTITFIPSGEDAEHISWSCSSSEISSKLLPKGCVADPGSQ